MKISNLFVAIAALFLLFTSSCTQDQINPELNIDPQLSESHPIVLGHVTEGGFTQTCSENDLLDIMDHYRGNEDNFTYTSASLVKNGSLYMIKSPVVWADGSIGDIWMHLQVVDGSIEFSAQREITKVGCTGSCSNCIYTESSTCYDCICNRLFETGNCDQIYFY